MTLIASTNTGGSWAIAFATSAGADIDLSGLTIDVEILTDIGGPAKTIGDGGLTTAVGGTGGGTLTCSLPDGHGLNAGVYPVHARYHNGNGNWLDLHKGLLKISTRGGISSFESVSAYDGAVASTASIALPGAKGDAGEGVPIGGTSGQFLRKASATDYDTEWVNLAGGGDMVAANNLADLTDSDAALGNLGLTATVTELNYTDGVTSAIQTQIDGKAATSHGHAISDTTGLQAALDGKAASTHSHAISDTTGLQTALDGKQPLAGILTDLAAITPAQGQVAYFNGTNWVALPAGTSGNFLKTQGTGANPIWDSIPGGGDMLAANNLSDLADADAALGNLGLTATATELNYTDGVTSAIQAQIDGKAATSHGHAISDTTGLQAALDAKAATTHSHAISDVTGLQTALDGKAASSHSHAISDTTGLQTALDGKQPLAGILTDLAAITPAQGQVAYFNGTNWVALPAGTSGNFLKTQGTGANPIWDSIPGGGDMLAANNLSDLADADAALGNLGLTATATELNYTDGVTSAIQAQIDGKAATSHGHAISDTTGLQAALDAKAATTHSHAISDVTGLQTALDGKAASSHSHVISDTTGLQGALDAKASLTGAETLTNKTLTAPALSASVVNTPASVNWTGTEALDPANGDIQDITLTGDVTTLTDNMADGEAVILQIDDGTAFAITWPTITWVSDSGSAPTLQTTGDTHIQIWKNGTTLFGFAANGA